MKKFLAVALVGLFATSARADTLTMINVADSSSVGVTLNPGDTFVLGFQVGVHADAAANVRFVNIFLDAVGLGGGAVEVVGASFQAGWTPGEDRSASPFITNGGNSDDNVDAGSFPMAIDGASGNTNEANPACPDCPLDPIFGYHLVSKEESPTAGIAPGTSLVVEHVTVRAVSQGTVNLYWENPGTSLDTINRPVRRPTVSEVGAGKDLLGPNVAFLLGPTNVLLLNGTAGADPSPLTSGENPFIITILPEPATMALFGLGGLALLRRRRNA